MNDQNNYDAEFCGNLAIHHTNTVQDYGCLVVLESSSFNIIQGSDNLSLIGLPNVREMIGVNFCDLLSITAADNFKNAAKQGLRNRIPFQLSLVTSTACQSVEILAHFKESMIILEIEPLQDTKQRSFAHVFQEVRSFISTLEHTDDLQKVCESSIKEIKRLAGFDGIRLYQFDAQWNGTVIAEEIAEGLESYLGQTFPASDVPKQARAMYLKNPFRLIPNRDYSPSRLYPVINPLTHGFLDLSDYNLRSVANVHLEYMANMHVTASMSIRIIVNNNLWGLISCHHITAKYLGMEQRSVFEWLSMEISHRISSLQKRKELQYAAQMLQLRSKITESILAHSDIAQGLIEQRDALLSIMNCTGFAVSVNGKLDIYGEVPPPEELENLILWLESKGINQVYHTTKLSEVYEEAKTYTTLASGLLAIPIDERKGDFLLCFRPEVIQNIKWGGDPSQAINFAKDGLSYHPRNSFSLWLQTVHAQSTAWLKEEEEMAESLRNFLFEFRSKQLYS